MRLARNVPYSLVVFSLLVWGVAGNLLAAFLQLEEGWRDLFRATADGALVCFVVGVFVEPYLRSRFLRETRADVFWGIFNEKAAPAYKSTLLQLAGTKHYFKEMRWKVTFEWEDKAKGILEIAIEVRSDGVVHDPGGYVPDRKLWVLASCDDYESQYVEWSIYAPTVPSWRTNNHFVQPDLGERGLTVREPSGRIYVDEEKIAGDRTIPEGTEYTSVRKMTMRQREFGFGPLVYSRPTLCSEVAVGGSALNDLVVTVFQTSRLGEAAPIEEERSGVERDPVRIEHVTLPGQAAVLTWRPLRPEERAAAAAVAAGASPPATPPGDVVLLDGSVYEPLPPSAS